ncbi:MAG: Crp/Fnr family transcriptional regulator [Candidatus Rokubacteria bacterium]|nr:Crp/Fnr family transcriptional regulator [Candidatus Rokubacteria bacterium]
MTTKAVGALLRANAIFRGVPAKEIEALIRVTQTESRRPREFLFMEGDPSLWLYIVNSGRVKILKHSRAGKDVVLELLGPGEIFGGIAVLEKRPYPATAQAMETTEVLKIPRDGLLALSDRHPSIVREMALMIGQRLRTAHEAVKSLAVEPVEPRLAATLMRLADREGKPSRAGVELPYHLTRQGLADMAGTTVETTIRVVSRWIKEGLVVDDSGRLVLKKPDALRALAQGEPEDA